MAKNENHYHLDHEKAILNLPDKSFFSLVARRLNIPLREEIHEKHIQEDQREYWTIEYLREKLFKEMASKKDIITYKGVDVTIHKYYSQASRLLRWIPIVRPPPEFVINMSDLSSKTILELKCLDKIDYNYVIKRAVSQIFEYIDPQTYRMSLAKNLKVRLDK